MENSAMENSDKTTRKGSPPIKVYCLPEERQQVAANARAVGLSLSTYLLNVGVGYQVRGIVDNKLNDRGGGDLSRVQFSRVSWDRMHDVVRPRSDR